jgi:hypothetical protein
MVRNTFVSRLEFDGYFLAQNPITLRRVRVARLHGAAYAHTRVCGRRRFKSLHKGDPANAGPRNNFLLAITTAIISQRYGALSQGVRHSVVVADEVSRNAFEERDEDNRKTEGATVCLHFSLHPCLASFVVHMCLCRSACPTRPAQCVPALCCALPVHCGYLSPQPNATLRTLGPRHLNHYRCMH